MFKKIVLLSAVGAALASSAWSARLSPDVWTILDMPYDYNGSGYSVRPGQTFSVKMIKILNHDLEAAEVPPGETIEVEYSIAEWSLPLIEGPQHYTVVYREGMR